MMRLLYVCESNVRQGFFHVFLIFMSKSVAEDEMNRIAALGVTGAAGLAGLGIAATSCFYSGTAP